VNKNRRGTWKGAFKVKYKPCRQFTKDYSWKACTQQFLSLIQLIRTDKTSKSKTVEKSG
jgi:hypothetical protein